MKEWRPLVKLQIAGKGKFIGPGCRDLLLGIRECGSVRLACARMDMSYSKAWRILRTLETEAGFEALSRKQGGRNGGETSLTPEGDRLLERFLAYERECGQAVGDIFQRHFGGEAEQ